MGALCSSPKLKPSEYSETLKLYLATADAKHECKIKAIDAKLALTIETITNTINQNINNSMKSIQILNDITKNNHNELNIKHKEIDDKLEIELKIIDDKFVADLENIVM